jgi:arylsulfatase A-like enzyme
VALRTDRYKYVQWPNGKEELYDLLNDPGELQDIAAGADLTWARRLAAEHAATRLELGGSRSAEGPDTDRAAIRARLAGLGYV